MSKGTVAAIICFVMVVAGALLGWRCGVSGSCELWNLSTLAGILFGAGISGLVAQAIWDTKFREWKEKWQEKM